MFKELVMRRESVRAYDGRPVPRDVLLDLVDTARFAPNTRNRQRWRFLICDGDSARKVASTAAVPEGAPAWHRECPAFILITTDTRDPAAPHDFPMADAAIAAAYLSLAAADRGLGSCILGSCGEEALKALFPVGDDRRVELAVAIGYPKEPPQTTKDRKPLGELVSFAE